MSLPQLLCVANFSTTVLNDCDSVTRLGLLPGEGTLKTIENHPISWRGRRDHPRKGRSNQKNVPWQMRVSWDRTPLAVWAESAERCQYYGEKRVGFGSNHPKLGFIIEQKWYIRNKYICSCLSNIIQNVHTAKWDPRQL